MALMVLVTADSKFPVDRKRLRSVLSSQWETQGIGGEASVSVAVVGARKMAELHERHLHKQGPTDVLAFPQQATSGDEYGFVVPHGLPLELGDIVICYPLAIEQAVQEGVFVDDRIEALAIHGFRNLFWMGEEGNKFKV